MGLDVALGVVILIAAFRGWLQGFTYQVIRNGGLIASVYLAAPVRDQVRPYLNSYLPSIEPGLLDRMMWWVSLSVCYIVLVGSATLALKMTKRPEIPGMPPQRSRNDQFAGFLLGLTKGGLVAAFLVAGLETFGLKQVEAIPWAQEQVKGSQALDWNKQYQPAAKVWDSVPVRHFVNHIRRMGYEGEGMKSDPTHEDGDRPVVQTARRTAGEGRGPAGRAKTDDGTPAPPAPHPPAGLSPEPDGEGVLKAAPAAADGAAAAPKSN